LERAFATSKMDNSTVERLLELMATREVPPPEKVHSWGKIMVNPKPGESFLSWLTRQAWAFSITPKKLVQSEKEYWLIKENISLSVHREWLLKSDVLPISTAWENVLQQRGLNIEISELQLNISKWFDLASEPKITKKILKNYYLYVLRYCPLCWKDENSRYFRILWRLPFVLVCPEHGVELKEYCSSCGELLFSEKKRNKSLVIIFQDLKEEWLTKCRFCNHSLLEEAVKEKPELATLQKKVLNTLLSDSNWATPRGYLIFWHTYLTAIEKQKPDSVETHLKFMDTMSKRPPLILNSKYYSREFLTEIEWRLQAVTLHLSGISYEYLSRKFDLTNWSIMIFVKELLKGKPIDYIIKRQLGYRGKLGLELAQAELRELKDKKGRLPLAVDIETGGIRSAIGDQEWVSFGVKKWNDLLRKTFGEINTQMGVYIGQQGLEMAIAELREFKVKHGRLPKSHETGTGGIIDAIVRGEWFSFGIRNWNDLLRKTFGKVNKEKGLYGGKQGLERAIAELREFKGKYSRLPKSTDTEMGWISYTIYRREWVSFGIKKWNDLLRKTFGEVNIDTGKYTGKHGLERAITELLDFKTMHGRLPKSNDKKMSSIKGVIIRGEWASYGIMKWNDLLRKTFGEVNMEMGMYTGKQGLDRAIAELLDFKTMHGRSPNSNDKEIHGIKGAIIRGEWASVGINKWNDLLMKTFGEINTRMGAGKQGLNFWNSKASMIG